MREWRKLMDCGNGRTSDLIRTSVSCRLLTAQCLLSSPLGSLWGSLSFVRPQAPLRLARFSIDFLSPTIPGCSTVVIPYTKAVFATASAPTTRQSIAILSSITWEHPNAFKTRPRTPNNNHKPWFISWYVDTYAFVECTQLNQVDSL